MGSQKYLRDKILVSFFCSHKLVTKSPWGPVGNFAWGLGYRSPLELADSFPWEHFGMFAWGPSYIPAWAELAQAQLKLVRNFTSLRFVGSSLFSDNNQL